MLSCFVFKLHYYLSFFHSVAIRSSAIYLLRGQGAGACYFFHYLSSYIPRDAAHRIITLAFLMVCLHCPTSKQIQKPRQREIQINSHRTQWKSVLTSVSLQYEHLHTILYNPFYRFLYWLGVGQYKCTIDPCCHVIFLLLRHCQGSCVNGGANAPLTQTLTLGVNRPCKPNEVVLIKHETVCVNHICQVHSDNFMNCYHRKVSWETKFNKKDLSWRY